MDCVTDRTPGAGIALVYRFNDDILSVERSGDRITLDVKSWRPLSFTPKAPAYADAVMALAGKGCTLRQFEAIGAASGDPAQAAKAARYYFERFARGRLLAWRIADGDNELARVDALADRYQPKLDDPPAAPLHLCRFAYLHRTEDGTVLESGLAPARMTLGDGGLHALAGTLARPRPAGQDAFAEALWRLGFLDVAAPTESEARRCWEFHDLLMHSASRQNRNFTRIGASYRFEKQFPSAPAAKPPVAGEAVDLPPVDAARIRQGSGALDAIQDRRKSIRSFADEPISLSALGEFLWRTCRTTAHVPSKTQDLLSRPYPAGGSINELEFYLAVSRCDGLEPAIYHYDSHGHRCIRIADSRAFAAQIVERSANAMGLGTGNQRPDVTIVITSRLPRLAWKYEGMAYRATLMNAGVVYHLMYLVATDMGLAGCANGTGDSRLLAEAAGLDPFEETAVAEFVLALPRTASAPS